MYITVETTNVKWRRPHSTVGTRHSGHKATTITSVVYAHCVYGPHLNLDGSAFGILPDSLTLIQYCCITISPFHSRLMLCECNYTNFVPLATNL